MLTIISPSYWYDLIKYILNILRLASRKSLFKGLQKIIKLIVNYPSTYFYGKIFKFILCWAKFIFPDFHGGSNYCTADKNISSLSYRYNELDE